MSHLIFLHHIIYPWKPLPLYISNIILPTLASNQREWFTPLHSTVLPLPSLFHLFPAGACLAWHLLREHILHVIISTVSNSHFTWRPWLFCPSCLLLDSFSCLMFDIWSAGDSTGWHLVWWWRWQAFLCKLNYLSSEVWESILPKIFLFCLLCTEGLSFSVF